ncbi:MAG: hypothetical protein Fur0016_02290 [Anaerolineales bacterium]
MRLSKFASEIAESPTLGLNEEARLLRERGEPVIHLGIGEPKNKTPINAILASAAKLTSGEVKGGRAEGVTPNPLRLRVLKSPPKSSRLRRTASNYLV